MSLPRTIERTYEREESTRGRRDTSKAAQVAQPVLRTPTIQILPPPAIYDAAVKMGAEKAQMPWYVSDISCSQSQALSQQMIRITIEEFWYFSLFLALRI